MAITLLLNVFQLLNHMFYITFLALIKKVVKLVASLTNHCNLKKQQTKNFKSFEYMELQLFNEREKKVIPNVIYRKPHVNFSLFSQEIESLILESEINKADVICSGDFNFWVNYIKINDAQNFFRLLITLALLIS